MRILHNKILKKSVKILFLTFRPILFRLSMPLCTRFQYLCLRLLGTQFDGMPKYLSAKIWFDGADYSKIHIGKRVTISSNIRILTHDWAADTIIEGLDKTLQEEVKRPIGVLRDIYIGDYSFIGTGTLLLPGCKIGRCCLVGGGTVVRGNIPDYSIVIGNPCVITNTNTQSYISKLIEKYAN